MKCIHSHSDDPYFNLAAEEYLLKNFSHNIYFQYVNRPAVVVGKHQNALAEVDVDFLEKEGILLARRISGGGAVYHDRGNVNYSFITNEQPGDFIKFDKYTAPVIRVLEGMGVEARLGKRNELLAGDFKISGTASHVFKRRVLHHGTLLYDADLTKLSQCLYVNMDRFTDKAVRSVRSQVINLSTLIPDRVTSAVFDDQLFDRLTELLEEVEILDFTQDDIQAINDLVATKFNLWDWNYGYSPRYEISRDLVLDNRKLHIQLVVQKGIIEELNFSGDDFPELASLSKSLQGSRHQKGLVINIIETTLPGFPYVKNLFTALF